MQSGFLAFLLVGCTVAQTQKPCIAPTVWSAKLTEVRQQLYSAHSSNIKKCSQYLGQLSQHSFHCHRKTLLLQLCTFADVFQTLFFCCVVESCACYTCECDGCDAQKHAALASHLSLFLPENCSQYYFMVCFLFNRLSISSSCKSYRSIAHARSQCRIYPMRAPPPRHSVPLITRTTACNWLKAT